MGTREYHFKAGQVDMIDEESRPIGKVKDGYSLTSVGGFTTMISPKLTQL